MRRMLREVIKNCSNKLHLGLTKSSKQLSTCQPVVRRPFCPTITSTKVTFVKCYRAFNGDHVLWFNVTKYSSENTVNLCVFSQRTEIVREVELHLLLLLL
ncbi:hypothetical protein XENORESO_007782 [Xenotaenia resolanae]|uniref:Uncharacterized protein n=1 Tax=Xenotaenia resolanae TaxID=208358 RepID=A0ABV0WYB3_9TELE